MSSSHAAFWTNLWSSSRFRCVSTSRSCSILERCSSLSLFTCSALFFASSLRALCESFQRSSSASWCWKSCLSSSATRCLWSFFSSICSCKSSRICCCWERVISRCCSFSRSSTSLACFATSDQRLSCCPCASGTVAKACARELLASWPEAPGAKDFSSSSSSGWPCLADGRADLGAPSRQVVREEQENSETEPSPRALRVPSPARWKTLRSKRRRLVSETRPFCRNRSTSPCTSVTRAPPRASMSRSRAVRSSSRWSPRRRPWWP
mmetsp:Transcript_99571/g.277194  ORF Transcript_99571/g.277194 Transcript_99571/m.277194 type:complete len:266 (+) Transcript_99571:755-1552(+)